MESVSASLHGKTAQILAPSIISLTGILATAHAVAPLLIALQISTSTLTAALASASQSSTVVSMKRTLTESSTPVPANSSALLSNATTLESTGINLNAHADASTKLAQKTTTGTLAPANAKRAKSRATVQILLSGMQRSARAFVHSPPLALMFLFPAHQISSTKNAVLASSATLT